MKLKEVKEDLVPQDIIKMTPEEIKNQNGNSLMTAYGDIGELSVKDIEKSLLKDVVRRFQKEHSAVRSG